MKCPKCVLETYVKAGFIRKKQRFLCKNFGCQFTQDITSINTPPMHGKYTKNHSKRKEYYRLNCQDSLTLTPKNSSIDLNTV